MEACTDEDVHSFFAKYKQQAVIGPIIKHPEKRRRIPQRVEICEASCNVLFIETDDETFCIRQKAAFAIIDPRSILAGTPELPAVQFRLFVDLLESLGAAIAGALPATLAEARGRGSFHMMRGAFKPRLCVFCGARLVGLLVSYKQRGTFDSFWMHINARPSGVVKPLRDCYIEMHRKGQFRYHFVSSPGGGEAVTSRSKWKTLHDGSTDDDIWIVVQMALDELVALPPRRPLHMSIDYSPSTEDTGHLRMAALGDTV
jgi:hypothetical protein